MNKQQVLVDELLNEVGMCKEVGEFRDAAKARLKYLKKRDKLKSKKQEKIATLVDEMYKEAGLVNRASKSVNGVRGIVKTVTPPAGKIGAIPAIKKPKVTI